MNAVFSDRHDAGKKLAQQLLAYKHQAQTIVLALPRGGVPVAYEIAKNLNIPLDVCLVRKLGLPNYPEIAMGAVAEAPLADNSSSSITIVDQDTAQASGVTASQIQAIAAKEKAQLKWRESCYRHSRPMLTIEHRTIILVDDGMATGLTMQAAVEVLRQHHPAKIMISIPVASQQAIANLQPKVDQITCLVTPKTLNGVGFWYKDFTQTTDQEVCNLLTQQTCQNFA
ncbi:phosphoribosyl transferase [Pleurocapsa sp. CCALA 161]|uniref:phosphoribosyltransferase n=1 Tax=Pleurocapsa sp. CCALA 161 TaxID=2107688 RepID=UPI000D057428|nr:phosphoribosyltransferase family protein [Pleurocapsa sp. CCALA 161]PSB11786.1 phosphoribosyl transferase [Pleurocapsa sp. CCALA 161]